MTSENKRDIVRLMDKVKLDVVEARILTGTDDLEHAALAVESWGGREIMITHAGGVLLREDGRTYYERFSNQSIVGRTGRGDTTFAAYLGWRLEHNVAESLEVRGRSGFDQDGSARTVFGNGRGRGEENQGEARHAVVSATSLSAASPSAADLGACPSRSCTGTR